MSPSRSVALPPPMPAYRDRRQGPTDAAPKAASGSLDCVNVTDLGCIADGVFDNYTILQDALDYWGDSDRNAVTFCFPPQPSTNPNGFNHYLVKQSLFISPENCQFRAIPTLNTYDGVALCTDGDEDIIIGGFDFSVDGLLFILGMDADGTENETGTGTAINNVRNLWLHRAAFYGAGKGVSGVRRLMAESCGFYDLDIAIQQHPTLGATLDVSGGEIFLCKQAVKAVKATGASIRGVHLANQSGDGTRAYLDLTLETFEPGTITVTGNKGKDVDFPMALTSTIPGTLAVTGNAMHGISAKGIVLDGSYDVLSGNTLVSSSNTNANDGIEVHGDHNRVTANMVKDFRYGVSVLAGATNTAGEGNTLSGSTGALLDAGTGTTNVNNMA